MALVGGLSMWNIFNIHESSSVILRSKWIKLISMIPGGPNTSRIRLPRFLDGNIPACSLSELSLSRDIPIGNALVIEFWLSRFRRWKSRETIIHLMTSSKHR